MELRAKPGFDWSRVIWGGPQDRRTEHCSYCGARLSPAPDEDDSIPLMLWKQDGSCAEFCEDCQRNWFGMQRVED